ncbi:MAG: nucleotidyltransferase family protein, partial [Bdellovibrionales bacterium]
MLPRVLILAGGLGTRLSKVLKDLPKPMAPIAGRPFLEYQIEFLRRQGFRKFTLLTGHLSDSIKNHFGDGKSFGVDIDFSVEHEPLGTGGAIRQAMEASTDQEFLVLNGDSLFAADLTRFLNFAKPPISIALKYTEDLSRFGSVTIDKEFNVTRFQEKTDSAREGYINAGVYFISRDALTLMPKGKFSFETEVMMPLANQLKGIPCGGLFVDIGTPESFIWSQDHLPAWLN